MKILKADSAKLTEPIAVALGMFDGVHLGHQKIIEQAQAYAAEYGLKTAVVTLANHPRELTQGRAPSLLTDLEARLKLFERLAIDYVLVLDFTPDLMNTSAEEYLQKYLVDVLNSKFISIGYDHHFGHGREGSPKMLAEWCKQQGVELNVLEAFNFENYLVSSSVIRELIREGNISLANRLLGHKYFVLGEVVHGDGRGNQIGYPTANLKLSPGVRLPAHGVYAAEVELEAGTHKALVNIGTRPTFKTDDQLSVEVHILDFEGDLYDQILHLAFVDKIRDEIKFSSKEELIAQIEKDKECYTN